VSRFLQGVSILAVMACLASPCAAATEVATPAHVIAAAYPYGSVRTVAVHGNVAVARIDVRIEGEPYNGEMLLQRYPFGWQMIAIGSPGIAPCALAARGVDKPAQSAFASEIGLAANSAEVCGWLPVDIGPANDVVAVRALQSAAKSLIPRVHVVDGYAMSDWYGGGGGEDVFAKRDGTWHRIAGGGGAYDTTELVRVGVPPKIAAALTQVR
jgi:hypothetical protein